jgi:acyl-coenzyme A synthetase/AMP-(fatty) acid ligase
MGGELVHDLLDAAPPQAPAMAQHDRMLRYGDIADSSTAIAAWLRRIGVQTGDRVVIALSRARALDTPSFLYACSRIGAVFCVIHEQVAGAALSHVLEDAAPALVVSDVAGIQVEAASQGIAICFPDTDFGAAQRTATPQNAALRDAAQRTATQSAAAATLRGTAPREATQPAATPERVSPDAPACMIYTSGSTSRPKAVVSTHRQITFVARAIQSQLRYRADDVVYTPQPFSFDVGLYQIFLAALSGARVWLPGPHGANALMLQELLESKATVLPAVPAVAEVLAWSVGRSRAAVPVPGLRLLTNTGAAMPRPVLARAAQLNERARGQRGPYAFAPGFSTAQTVRPRPGFVATPQVWASALTRSRPRPFSALLRSLFRSTCRI